MSRPANRMSPSEEIIRVSASPSVVLPEPDSPTTPSVWPARTVTSIPSTAFTWSTVVRRNPFLIGNHTFMPSPRSTVSASGSASGGLPFGSAARRCRVYSCCGLANSASVGPSSTILPFVITQTRSAILRTMPRSWVMNSIDMPFFSFSRSSSSRICACTVTSSAVVGSSAISSSGSLASAIAIITRWRWPPESWCGNAPSRRSGSGMPTSCRSSSVRARAFASPMP